MAGKIKALIQRGVQLLLAKGREANQETGDLGESKGIFRSKTILSGIAIAIYPIGLEFGWWSPEGWETIAIPLLGLAGIVWGRSTVKKSVG